MRHASVFRRLTALTLCICLLLSAVSFAEPGDSASYAPLKYEMRDSDDVRAMQRRLKELGFFNDYISGGYFNATAAAVQNFQKAAGLEVNRKLASSEMLALLFSDDAPTVSGDAAPTATPVPTEMPEGTIRFGLKDSDAVRQLQTRLKELGFFSSSITGNYFDTTKTAVEAFQKTAGLPVSGNAVSEETLEALYSESAPGKDFTVTATVTPMPTPTPRPVITQVPGATPRPALSYGTTSSAVKEMQLRLKELGYFSAGATGGYWSETAKAVATFQSAAKLSINSRVASSEMLEVLFSEEAPAKTDSTAVYYTELRFSMSGNKDVRALQERLKELGYFNDVCTGGYYRMTAQAVAAFQEAIGMPVNGNVATVTLQKALFASNAPAYGAQNPTVTPEPTETPEPTKTPEPTETPEPTKTPEPTATAKPTEAPEEDSYTTLTYAMTGSDAVRRMQQKLYELGYLKAKPTGGYWSKTVAAVKAFLTDNGLTGNGKTATAEMQALLMGSGNASGGEESAPVYKLLSYYAKNNSAVKAMQNRLKELGYFKSSATGNYFSITASAVAAFQKAVGMPVNGKQASPEMQALLFSDRAPALGEQYVPEATATPEPTATPEAPGDEGIENGDTPQVSFDYQPLKYGTRNSDEVRAMQKKLKERGFFKASVTGGYWAETTKAVAAFQEYAHLEVNGRLASSETLGLLFYTGDLDALINGGGIGGAPIDPDAPSDDPIGFDPDKYKDARTDVMLSHSDKGEQVQLLIMRLSELGYLDDSDPTYYDTSVVSAVKWFQNTNLLDSDGVAGPKTLELLYSAYAMSADDSMKENSSADVPVEVEGEEIKVTIGSVKNIDWFSDSGKTYYDRRSGLFKDGATAIVTDVATGISFRVRRCGGYNHADVEPMTAFDTWQMYRIYNYKWAWTRHAIYVTLSNGVTLAGSMNGMPHGSAEITDNNYPGHNCIHFLNSRTHGTDKVDPDHQSAVAKAAR